MGTEGGGGVREVGELKDGGGFELSWVCSTFFSGTLQRVTPFAC